MPALLSGKANYAYYIIQQLPTHPADEENVEKLRRKARWVRRITWENKQQQQQQRQQKTAMPTRGQRRIKVKS